MENDLLKRFVYSYYDPIEEEKDMLKKYFKYKVEGDEFEPYGLQNIELTTVGMTWTELSNQIGTNWKDMETVFFFLDEYYEYLIKLIDNKEQREYIIEKLHKSHSYKLIYYVINYFLNETH